MSEIKYKSKWVPPYNKEGKPFFTHKIFSKMAGVYIIKRGSKILYVGSSQYNLYKTLYRHFETWYHKYQKVITYASNLTDIKVRVFITTYAAAPKWEAYFLRKLDPPDNDLSVWYKIRPQEAKQMDQIVSQTEEEDPF